MVTLDTQCHPAKIVSMMEKKSLRERKKERTRKALIDSATSLFLDKGFDNTTVDEIADAVDVSRRTFFRYFKIKEAVVFTNHEMRVGIFKKLLEENRDVSDPMSGVKRAFVGLAAAYSEMSESLRNEWAIVTASPILIAKDVELDFEYESAIADYLMQQSGAELLDCKIRAGALFGAIRVVMQEWFSNDCKQDLEKLGERALALF